jgi:hypothetical protein
VAATTIARRITRHARTRGLARVITGCGRHARVHRAQRAAPHRARQPWEQVPVDDVWGVAYDRLLYTAHAIVVAEYVRPTA